MLCPNKINEIRDKYLSYLQRLLESVTVEELEYTYTLTLKNVLFALRTFINENYKLNGVNMYVNYFLLSPMFSLHIPFSNCLHIFMIENGISQPAADVVVQ